MIALLGIHRKSPSRVHLQHLHHPYGLGEPISWNECGHIAVFQGHKFNIFYLRTHEGVDLNVGVGKTPTIRNEQ